MAEPGKRIIVDDDWKAEAQREKERLAQESEQVPARTQASGFMELLNLIAMQAVVGLGGFASPTGEAIPPNLDAAKHFIDLMGVIEAKTRGNLTDDEKKILDQTIYELRLRYMQMATAGAGGGGPDYPGLGIPPPRG